MEREPKVLDCTPPVLFNETEIGSVPRASWMGSSRDERPNGNEALSLSREEPPRVPAGTCKRRRVTCYNAIEPAPEQSLSTLPFRLRLQPSGNRRFFMSAEVIIIMEGTTHAPHSYRPFAECHTKLRLRARPLKLKRRCRRRILQERN